VLRNLLYIWLCCLLPQFVLGQELKPTLFYMNLPEVSQIAKDIHSGRIQASDNAPIYTIADSMSTENNKTRPFYIFLVSKMLLNSQDEKLKDNLGGYCRRIMQNKPDPVVTLLFSKSVKPEYKDEWEKAISKNIAASCDKILLDCFKTTRLLSLEVSNNANKDKVEAIFNSVRSNLNLQRHQ